MGEERKGRMCIFNGYYKIFSSTGLVALAALPGKDIDEETGYSIVCDLVVGIKRKCLVGRIPAKSR